MPPLALHKLPSQSAARAALAAGVAAANAAAGVDVSSPAPPKQSPKKSARSDGSGALNSPHGGDGRGASSTPGLESNTRFQKFNLMKEIPAFNLKPQA